MPTPSLTPTTRTSYRRFAVNTARWRCDPHGRWRTGDSAGAADDTVGQGQLPTERHAIRDVAKGRSWSWDLPLGYTSFVGPVRSKNGSKSKGFRGKLRQGPRGLPWLRPWAKLHLLAHFEPSRFKTLQIVYVAVDNCTVLIRYHISSNPRKNNKHFFPSVTFIYERNESQSLLLTPLTSGRGRRPATPPVTLNDSTPARQMPLFLAPTGDLRAGYDTD